MAMLLTVVCAQAQIEWLSKEYDFGSFHEAGGTRSGEVRFVNRGDKPTMINRVKLTCGCTSETHTEGIIEPGDTAIVRFAYNPTGRPGRFEKSIRVYTGDDNQVTTIRMKGVVIGAPQTLRTDYPIEAGSLRLSTGKVDFGKVRHGTSRHHFINLYNQGSDTIRPAWRNADDALDVGISTPAVIPGDLATMSIYLNTRDESRMGPVEYVVEIADSEQRTDSVVTFRILADIVPDTEKLTAEEIAHGPRIECTPTLIDLGVVKGGRPLPLTFGVLNAGENRLHIDRIYSRTPGLKMKRYPVTLKPGKKGKAEGVIDLSAQPAGPFRITVEIVSNDPIHPVATIAVCGEKE